jgi:hypothetical protein
MQYSGRAGQIIDWALLWERLRHQLGLVNTAVRYQAGRTNWQPPLWWRRLHLTWFRVALLGLVLLFFSRNQVRFKIDVVDRGGEAIAATSTAATVANQMGIAALPFASGEAKVAFNPAAIETAAVRKYVARFGRVAETEARKFGIPAPVKLAMAILESQAGQTRAALDVNNHFGPATEGSFYESAWANWRAHSLLIDQRFPQLRQHVSDTEAWLQALSATDYNRDPAYAAKLRQIIQHFDL